MNGPKGPFRDMATENYTRRLTAVILNLVQPEVDNRSADPKTLH